MSERQFWCAADGSCAVEIPQSIVDAMVTRADATHPLETGASLVGGYSGDQRTAYVDVVAPTPEDAERSRYGFRRGMKGLAAFLERVFIKSKGKQYYIGEFHSHPGGAPTPSPDDDAAQFSIARDPRAQCTAPVLVIVGADPGARQIGVYVYSRHGTKWVLAPCERGCTEVIRASNDADVRSSRGG